MKLFYNKDANKFKPMLNGSRCCVNSFRAFFGVTQYKWYSARKMILNGIGYNPSDKEKR